MNTTLSRRTVVSTLALGAVLATALVLGTPNVSQAATYAYVSQEGSVQTVIANSWMDALTRAVGIAVHSGVLLLDSEASYDVVGDVVRGV